MDNEDLVKKLHAIILNADMRIAELEAELEEARKALEPFSRWAARELDKSIPQHIQEDESTPVLGSGEFYEDTDAVVVTVGDLRRARAVVGSGKDD